MTAPDFGVDPVTGKVAFEYEGFAAYVSVATTTTTTLELIHDMPVIYALFVTNRPSTPGVVYLISRIATLLYSSFWLHNWIGGGECAASRVAVAAFWTIAIASTSLLFFFRARALYKDRPVVVGLLAILWLCTLGASLTLAIPVGSRDESTAVVGSQLCTGISDKFPPFTGLSIIISAFYDAVVFCAISYRLYPGYDPTSHSTWKKKIGWFFKGEGLPRLSKALLQSGQQYYMVSVVANTVVLVFYLHPIWVPALHIMVTLVNICVVNSMTCKVFRDIKFGCTPGMSLLLPSIDTHLSGSFRVAPRRQSEASDDTGEVLSNDGDEGAAAGSYE
ncbi:unnamed protein product [Peniophora sp. CBMAI 1063]|nr:unnamed protein product [Peniophora sp. CBMAI 1063]